MTDSKFTKSSRGSYAFHRRARQTQETFESVLQDVTFEAWIGLPLPKRRRPDGRWCTGGEAVRLGGEVIGYIWEEWITVESGHIVLLCRTLVGSEIVTRSTADRAAVAFILASEWLSRQDVN